MKEIKIDIPEGYEVDKENSTFERIVFKKRQEIKTWDDFCEINKKIEGFFINAGNSSINRVNSLEVVGSWGKNVYLTEKQAKSARAAAMLSQLMPYYGGAITNKEWGNKYITKFIIYRSLNKISIGNAFSSYNLLAFNTPENRDRFLKHNEQLVKEYLMLD